MPEEIESGSVPDPGTLRMLVKEFESAQEIIQDGQTKIQEGIERIRFCIHGIDRVLKYYPEMGEEEKEEFINQKKEFEEFLESLQ